MAKLKPFDPEAFVTSMVAKADPLSTTSLGELVRMFIENQSAVGMRQFATRAGIARMRLKAITEGADPTYEEHTAIQQVFTGISERYDLKNAKRAKKS